jgi:hypothetical protein
MMTFAQSVAKHGDLWSVEHHWRHAVGDLDSFILMRHLTAFRWPVSVRNSFVLSMARGSGRNRVPD